MVLITARPGTERDAAEPNEWSLQVFEVDVVTPLHCVCHAFHTVPNAFAFCAITVSKLPSLLIIKSGILVVSNHSSPDGDSLQIPAHANESTGFRFSIRVAYGCSTATL